MEQKKYIYNDVQDIYCFVKNNLTWREPST
jgi:hypothetical protein